jgi:hypothetical protein
VLRACSFSWFCMTSAFCMHKFCYNPHCMVSSILSLRPNSSRERPFSEIGIASGKS